MKNEVLYLSVFAQFKLYTQIGFLNVKMESINILWNMHSNWTKIELKIEQLQIIFWNNCRTVSLDQNHV